jgi:hypothetical protein
MKKLLVSGCSVTHGAELYNQFMHPENVKLSYSQHLAEKLGYELINVALSASSNEYIFHSLIQELKNNQEIVSVVVMWTTTGRLYWNSKGRHYFFNGNFTSSMKDPVNFKMHDKQIDDCWFTGDSDEIVDKISKFNKFIVTDYFDINEERKKLSHYQMALKAVCEVKKIKLIELTWDFIDGLWKEQGRHPNALEHKQTAEKIYKTYYENI